MGHGEYKRVSRAYEVDLLSQKELPRRDFGAWGFRTFRFRVEGLGFRVLGLLGWDVPLILAVLNRDYNRGGYYYNPHEGLLV